MPPNQLGRPRLVSPWWIRRPRGTALSLPSLVSSHPRDLTLAPWPPSNRHRLRRIAAASDLPEQIEAGQKLRRVALYLLVQGIVAGSPESSPSSSSSSPPAAARRAPLPPFSTFPAQAEHMHASRVSSPSSWTFPLSSWFAG